MAICSNLSPHGKKTTEMHLLMLVLVEYIFGLGLHFPSLSLHTFSSMFSYFMRQDVMQFSNCLVNSFLYSFISSDHEQCLHSDLHKYVRKFDNSLPCFFPPSLHILNISFLHVKVHTGRPRDMAIVYMLSYCMAQINWLSLGLDNIEIRIGYGKQTSPSLHIY